MEQYRIESIWGPQSLGWILGKQKQQRLCISAIWTKSACELENLQRATLITDPLQSCQDHFRHCLTSAPDGAATATVCLALHRADRQQAELFLGKLHIHRAEPGAIEEGTDRLLGG